MKRRPLNSATLATATHKELIRVSDRTCAQVKVWMINKCKAQMIEDGLYNMYKSPKRGGQEREKKGGENTVKKFYLHESVPINQV